LYLPIHWLLMGLMTGLLAILVAIVAQPLFDYLF
jgi:hypothetical protein